MRPKAVAALARIAKAQADERQRTLAAARAAIEALESRERALEEEVVRERVGAGVDAMAFGVFLARVKRERAALAAAKIPLVAEEAAARAALSEAYRELKTLEELEARLLARAADAEAQAERLALDELAQRIAARGA